MTDKMLFLLLVMLLFALIVVAGALILVTVIIRKWGYTPEREQQWEQMQQEHRTDGNATRRKE